MDTSYLELLWSMGEPLSHQLHQEFEDFLNSEPQENDEDSFHLTSDDETDTEIVNGVILSAQVPECPVCMDPYEESYQCHTCHKEVCDICVHKISTYWEDTEEFGYKCPLCRAWCKLSQADGSELFPIVLE